MVDDGRELQPDGPAGHEPAQIAFVRCVIEYKVYILVINSSLFYGISLKRVICVIPGII